ncbi:pectinesterase family protein [Celerinatantimonas sp. YJH-8]|uniref:pectinesterase family protein n=1 Tax=Celerinatantimonas sp. YJH-8 TaxID=3228714 RepID=UPI0038C1C4A8
MKPVWLMPLIGLGFTVTCYATNYDAIVTKMPKAANEYSSLSAAIAQAPEQSEHRFKILVKNGIYTEKVNLKKSNISIYGQDQHKTVLEYESASGQNDAEGNHWGTSGSYVLAINGNNVTLKNITVKNSFDYLTNDAKASDDATKIGSSQAVALLIGTNATHVKVKDVTLLGYQDTLYVKDGSTSYFRNSTIKGNVDFIFGGGTAVFDSCAIIARPRGIDAQPIGFVTAPSTMSNVPYGLVFYYSYIGKEAGVPAHSYGLGRPWHPTRTFSDGRYADPDAIGYTLYFRSYLDDHVYYWASMTGHGKDGSTVTFDPMNDARFAEFQNFGPGAYRDGSNPRPQLSYRQAAQINLPHILGGLWYLKQQ